MIETAIPEEDDEDSDECSSSDDSDSTTWTDHTFTPQLAFYRNGRLLYNDVSVVTSTDDSFTYAQDSDILSISEE